MTTSPARSLTAKFIRQAIAALAIGVPFAVLPGLAQASALPAIPIYTANLDTDPLWGGSPGSPTTLDQITNDWSAAVMNGLIVSNPGGGLTLRDFYNPGSSGVQVAPVGTTPNMFAFEYTFTVGAASNPQGTFVSSFGGLTDISLALYQGAPSLYRTTPIPGTNPQGAGASPLDVGVLSTAGFTTGEYILQMAGLTAGPTYYLTVTGELSPGSTSGNFYGLAEDVAAVPLPGALLMFASALAGLGGLAGRRRLGEVVRKIGHGAIRGTALAAAALGLIVTALIPGGAQAAAYYTDVANAVSFPPPAGGTETFPLAGLIVGGASGHLTIPGNLSMSAPNVTGFAFDYQFDLLSPAILQASISQLRTNITTGPQFELFAGTPASPSASPLAVSTVGPTPGELIISYAGPAGMGMAPGQYFLAVTGSLAAGQTHGSLSGTMQLSAVPLPTALLLFGSAIGGLAIVEGFGKHADRKTKA